MNTKLHKKVSPRKGGAGSPYEGGVIGTINYLIYTEFYFPTGESSVILQPFKHIIQKKRSGI
jgi:hypothetical protein